VYKEYRKWGEFCFWTFLVSWIVVFFSIQAAAVHRIAQNSGVIVPGNRTEMMGQSFLCNFGNWIGITLAMFLVGAIFAGGLTIVLWLLGKFVIWVDRRKSDE
jgi:hypothetical protein